MLVTLNTTLTFEKCESTILILLSIGSACLESSHLDSESIGAQK